MKGKTKKIIGTLLLTVLSAGMMAGAVLYYYLLRPQVKGEEAAYIQIYPQDTQEIVLQKIAEVPGVSCSKGLEWLMEHYGYQKHIKPGNYAIKPGDSMRSLYLRLASGSQSAIRLVVPTVRTIDRMAQVLGKQLMADSASIAELFHSSLLYQRLDCSKETFPAQFIPNTYEVYWTVSPEALADRMHKEHQRFWNADRLAKAKAMGLTPDEVAVLASIVDEETIKNDEKPIVAGLYFNRLQRGIPLQADPTVKFALQDFSLRRIYHEHLKFESPYNTYLYKGLPPGPIRIPSIAGIESVLNYRKHSYLYMCAKEDFSGYHNFATSLSQHNANAKRYQQALNARGIR